MKKAPVNFCTSPQFTMVLLQCN